MMDLIKEHLANYSAGNWEPYKAALASDVSYEEIATGRRAKGPDAYIELVKRWKTAFPDLAAKLVGGLVQDDRAFVEVEWTGTQSGPLETPFGIIQPTNKSGSVRAVLAIKFKDGKIVENRHYFDVLTVLMQSGFAPFAATPQPAAKAAQVPPTRH